MPSAIGPVDILTASIMFGAVGWCFIFFATILAASSSAASSSSTPRSLVRRVLSLPDSTSSAAPSATSRGSPASSPSIRPIESASSPETCRPDRAMSSVFFMPIRRGPRWVPDAPGNRPRFTSGRPTRSPLTPTRAWVPMQISRPPPSAVPCGAEITGFSLASIALIVSGSDGSSGVLPNSLMSAPATKVRPAA